MQSCPPQHEGTSKVARSSILGFLAQLKSRHNHPIELQIMKAWTIGDGERSTYLYHEIAAQMEGTDCVQTLDGGMMVDTDEGDAL